MNAGTDTDAMQLPDGWQHGPVVTSLRAQPVERRHAIQAAVFAVLAAVWAPVGMLAFFAHWFGTWVLLSAAIAFVLLVPLPVGAGHLMASAAERAVAGIRATGAVLAAYGRRVGDTVGAAAQSIPRSAR